MSDTVFTDYEKCAEYMPDGRLSELFGKIQKKREELGYVESDNDHTIVRVLRDDDGRAISAVVTDIDGRKRKEIHYHQHPKARSQEWLQLGERIE